MEIAKIKSQIKSGQFDKWYIFAGEEGAIAKTYINMIAEKGGYRVQYADSYMDVRAKLIQKALLSAPTLYVVFDDKEFLKDEKQWASVKGLKDDLLIFQYSSVDKRLKFWKNFKDRAVFFEHLDAHILKKHIQKRLNLNDANCEKLIEVCENDYGRIMLEVDKIDKYATAYPEEFDDCPHDVYFDALLKEGTIFQPPKDAIFDFVAAVLDRTPKKALSLLNECREIGEPNMRLLTVLYTNMTQLLQVQDCGSDTSKSTGLTGWQIKNVKPYVGRYANEELVDALMRLRRLEKGIKVGEVDEAVTVDYFLMTTL